MHFIGAVIAIAAVGVTATAKSSSTTSSTSSAASATSSTLYIDPAAIGTFNLTVTVPSTDPANRAFINRQEEELLPNRTLQARHGSNLRELSKGKPFDARGVVNGSSENIESFMYKFGIAGLMVVKDGAVRAEKYQYGNMPSSRNVVQSCTKSFVSTALGIAIVEGKLKLSDKVSKWVPELKTTPWGDITILNLINMDAGVSASPTSSDYFDIYWSTNPNAVFELFKSYQKFASPGQVFNYQDQNFYVTSVVVSRAVKEPIQDYISRNIWEPAGMKYDGYFRATGAGQVDGHGGLAIALSDMVRFSSFVNDNLKGHGGPKVPEGWFESISKGTTAIGIHGAGNISVVPGFGYQNGWWIPPRSSGKGKYLLGDDGAFAALGTYDSAIYVIPGLNTSIAYQANYPVHTGDLFYYGQEMATAIALQLKKEY